MDKYHKIKYIPLEKCVLLEGNPKNHDLPNLIKSLQKYGFRSVPEFDGTINQGKGGIVAGNGRIEALEMMKEDGLPAPKGIGIDENGEWCVPILFCFDAESEEQAIEYAIDHNSLTITGIDAKEALKIYDPVLFEQLLQTKTIDVVALANVDLQGFFNTIPDLTIQTAPIDIPTQENDTGISDSKLPSLIFGTYKIKLSEEELAHLIALYDAYIEKFSTDFGFASHLRLSD